MAETPKKSNQSPQKKLKPSPLSHISPQILQSHRPHKPQPLPAAPPASIPRLNHHYCRRNLPIGHLAAHCHIPIRKPPKNHQSNKPPQKSIKQNPNSTDNVQLTNPKLGTDAINSLLSSVSPDRIEAKKRKKCSERIAGKGKFGELCGSSMNLKCKFPNEDLVLLVTITCNEDLASAIAEYDRVSISSNKDMKIRAILFPHTSLKKISPPSSPSTASCLDYSSSKPPLYPRRV